MMRMGQRHGSEAVQAMPPSSEISGAIYGEEPILLVEDEGLLRKILGRNLAKRGYRVVEAETGEAALTSLHTETPALMLLDINLPDMTGWDVLRALPVEQRLRIPTIVVSAVMQNPKRLKEFSEVTFLHKPFPLEVLLRLVADKLGVDRANPAEES